MEDTKNRNIRLEHIEASVSEALFNTAVGKSLINPYLDGDEVGRREFYSIKHGLEVSIATALETVEAMELAFKADQLMNELLSNSGLAKAFFEYLASLKWGYDKEKFLIELFGQSYPLQVLPEIEMEKYLKYRGYLESGTSLEDYLISNPKMDWRRLESDPEFANSDEGIELAENLRWWVGSRSKSSFDKGNQPQIIVPIAQHPIIEAYLVNEIKTYGPKNKYSFGPETWVDEIWRSDSKHCQNALLQKAITSLPAGYVRPFDGPGEFEYKGYLVESLIRAYTLTKNSDLKSHLLTALDSYSGVNTTLNRKSLMQDPSAKEILMAVLSILIVDKDEEVIAKVTTLIEQWITSYKIQKCMTQNPELSSNDLEKDRTISSVLTPIELQKVYLNSFKYLSSETDFSSLLQLGIKIFGTRCEVELNELVENLSSEGDYANRRNALNTFLIARLEEIVQEDIPGIPDYLIKNISLEDEEITSTNVYIKLTEIGKGPNTPTYLKNSIIYKIFDRVKYSRFSEMSEEKAYQTVLSDLLEIYISMFTSSQGIYCHHQLGQLVKNTDELHKIDDENFWLKVEEYKRILEGMISEELTEIELRGIKSGIENLDAILGEKREE